MNLTNRGARILCLLLLVTIIRAAPKPCNRAVKVTAGPVEELGPAISPNGRWLAIEYFTRDYPDDPEIWTMPEKGRFADARPVFNDKKRECGELAWSPNSLWLSLICSPRIKSGLVTEQLFKVNTATREAIQLTNFPEGESEGAGTSWSRDGRIAFVKDGDIYTVSENGGSVTKLVDLHKNLPDVHPFFPSWSPDNSQLAFVGRGTGTAQALGHHLYVVQLGTGRISELFGGVGDDGPSWFDNAHILCSREESGPTSSIWLISVSGQSRVQLTHGSYDMAPAVDSSRLWLYFSRNEHITQPRRDEDFHIWKCLLTLD